MVRTLHHQVRAIDAKRLEAARLIANGFPDSHVAREVGVDRSTIFRWHRDPQFNDAIEQAKQEIVAEEQTLESLIPKAFKTIEDLLDGKAGVSAQAARVGLDVLKAAEQVRKTTEKGETSFEQRLRELDHPGD
jgi:transposase-like protein